MLASGSENEKVRRRGDREGGGVQHGDVGVAGALVRNTARSGWRVTYIARCFTDAVHRYERVTIALLKRTMVNRGKISASAYAGIVEGTNKCK